MTTPFDLIFEYPVRCLATRIHNSIRGLGPSQLVAAIRLPCGEVLKALTYTWLPLPGEGLVLQLRLLGDGDNDDPIKMTLGFTQEGELQRYELDGFFLNGIPAHLSDRRDWPQRAMFLIDTLYVCLVGQLHPPITLDSEYTGVGGSIRVVGGSGGTYEVEVNDSTLGLLRGAGYYQRYGFRHMSASQRERQGQWPQPPTRPITHATIPPEGPVGRAAKRARQAGTGYLLRQKQRLRPDRRRWTPIDPAQAVAHARDFEDLRRHPHNLLQEPRLARAAYRHLHIDNRMAKPMPPEFPLAINPELRRFADLGEYYQRVLVAGSYPEQASPTIYDEIPRDLAGTIDPLDLKKGLDFSGAPGETDFKTGYDPSKDIPKEWKFAL